MAGRLKCAASVPAEGAGRRLARERLRKRLMVRFLHTADWQLGKQFENLGAPPDKLAFLRQGRMDVVRRIGQLAIDRSWDAILVAGDVFERNEVGAPN